MNEDIKTAIECPRPHHQLVPMKIDYEIGVKQVKMHKYVIIKKKGDVKNRPSYLPKTTRQKYEKIKLPLG